MLNRIYKIIGNANTDIKIFNGSVFILKTDKIFNVRVIGIQNPDIGSPAFLPLQNF